jgi:hypothetical protein
MGTIPPYLPVSQSDILDEAKYQHQQALKEIEIIRRQAMLDSAIFIIAILTSIGCIAYLVF